MRMAICQSLCENIGTVGVNPRCMAQQVTKEIAVQMQIEEVERWQRGGKPEPATIHIYYEKTCVNCLVEPSLFYASCGHQLFCGKCAIAFVARDQMSCFLCGRILSGMPKFKLGQPQVETVTIDEQN